jgi:antitoxin HicB
MNHTYSVVLRPEPEGGFTVLVPAFPEIVSFGETEPEALAMAKEAIELSLEHRVATGDEIPEPEVSQIERVTVLVPSAA